MNPVFSYFFTSKIGKFCWAMFVVTTLLAILWWATNDMRGFGPSDKFLALITKFFSSAFDMLSGLIGLAQKGDKSVTYALGGCAGGCLLQKALPDGGWETTAMLTSIGLWIVAVVS